MNIPAPGTEGSSEVIAVEHGYTLRREKKMKDSSPFAPHPVHEVSNDIN